MGIFNFFKLSKEIEHENPLNNNNITFEPRCKNAIEKKEWIPRDINDYPNDEFVQMLKRWRNDPSSEPEFEEWYKTGYLEGLPFTELKS